METPATIMLVDDEADVREVLDISLADRGYTVIALGSGTEALERFVREEPPIVLTDIKMPDMDGISLLREIKRRSPDTEVIMLTGHGDMDLAIESLKNEAVDFITKPVNEDILEIALRRARERILARKKLNDYTERLEDLLRKKTELQDNLANLGTMVGSIAHGIKGLLTKLDGGIYLMESAVNTGDTEEIGQGLGMLKESTERIKKMVLDILYYAKHRELNIETVDAAAFAGDVADVAEKKIKKNGIAFVRDFDPDAGALEVDPDSLHSALINILDNAADACIEDDAKSAHTIRFSMKQEDGAVVFEIQDNGPGMDAETRQRIFDLFFSSKGKKGTGFGLFIADNVVRQHGGTITVHSIKGRETRFIVKVPVSQGGADTPPED